VTDVTLTAPPKPKRPALDRLFWLAEHLASITHCPHPSDQRLLGQYSISNELISIIATSKSYKRFLNELTRTAGGCVIFNVDQEKPVRCGR
jgi:hypothetical protein